MRYLEGPKAETTERILPDRRFDERALRFPLYYADLINLNENSEGTLEDVKITVLDRYNSSGNRPLAISEIYLFGSEPDKAAKR
ncbi:MAG: hypothetical protein ABIR21_08810 [Chthoniobacterales bacterium]